jgi:hypothetical protein
MGRCCVDKNTNQNVGGNKQACGAEECLYKLHIGSLTSVDTGADAQVEAATGVEADAIGRP